ncbi:LysR family transcriptional regulator [Streptomyces sp. NPDC059063]|uniref:LysR family transcriptional regulator n=1 Tax=unclassified Streptomyces TaxID=2593676 RepID=UPI003697CBF7
MESRPLRYFVAVADELNFARAAERLGISSPPLSRAIRQLESDLGVTLFERTTHSVALTPAGRVLLTEARIALDALQAAGRRAQRAAAPDPKLVLAVKADGDAGLLEPILARYTGEPASVPVAVRLCGRYEHPRLLRQGEADAALLHEPFDRTGLDSEALTSEPRVAALAATHPLAARDRLTLADLGMRPDDLHRRPTESPDGSPGRSPGGTRGESPGEGRDLAQLLTLVALGGPTPLLPASVAARYPRPGVVFRLVPDAPPAVLAIAWPQQSRSTATAALVRAAVAAAEAAQER